MTCLCVHQAVSWVSSQELGMWLQWEGEWPLEEQWARAVGPRSLRQGQEWGHREKWRQVECWLGHRGQHLFWASWAWVAFPGDVPVRRGRRTITVGPPPGDTSGTTVSRLWFPGPCEGGDPHGTHNCPNKTRPHGMKGRTQCPCCWKGWGGQCSGLLPAHLAG